LEKLTKFENITLCVATWNLAGLKPYENVDLQQWLLNP